jgi:hypothetical protein
MTSGDDHGDDGEVTVLTPSLLILKHDSIC